MRKQELEDAEIGKRVRTLRLHRGMSQAELGTHLDVTFQQIQKYENGANRISAGRLHRIAEILGVPITYFYSGSEEHKKATHGAAAGIDFDSMQNPDAARMLRAYSRIRDRGIRLQLRKLTERLAGD